LFVRHGEIVEELLVGSCLFEWREILAVEVLDECLFHG